MPQLNPIEEHPEFPFGDTLATDRLSVWAESFDPAVEPGTPEADLVRVFLETIERYSFLERIVQGEIRYELPVHPRFLEQRERADDPLEQQSAELAEAEAELLGRPDVPALDLLDALEDIGIKLLPTGERAGETLLGGFFFEGETGPSFLVGADRDDPRAAFVVAHLLAHYVADFDPYRNRICRWDPETLENLDESPEEVRADLFARALLVPEETLRRYLEQLGSAVRSGESSVERGWEILATLFGVPDEILTDRLTDLGFETLTEQLKAARAVGKDAPGSPGPRSAGRPAGVPTEAPANGGAEPTAPAVGPFRLPQRYVHLALACYHGRIMERDVLARFLGLSEADTQRVIEWAEMGDGGRIGRSSEEAEP